MNEYDAIERDVLDVIDRWRATGVGLDDTSFDELARRIFAYQFTANEPYARYCKTVGTSEDTVRSWRSIPAVPAAAYKEATLATFDVSRAALAFETSGTTAGTGGRHYMKTSALYDAALSAGFDRFMLPDGARLRYLNLVPNPADRPQSSLGYMMAHVAATRGTGKTSWYVYGTTLLMDDFFRDLGELATDGEPALIATTAFALADVLDYADARGLQFRLPLGSRIMETGGFKGRARVVAREDLYARTSACFGIDENAIVAEYGMTELTSQWYDALPLRRKAAPPWLRARVVSPDGEERAEGVVGALVHVDLANLWSCAAVETEDLGARFGDEIVLLGRDAAAEPRGCSLDAETLALR